MEKRTSYYAAFKLQTLQLANRDTATAEKNVGESSYDYRGKKKNTEKRNPEYWNLWSGDWVTKGKHVWFLIVLGNIRRIMCIPLFSPKNFEKVCALYTSK